MTEDELFSQRFVSQIEGQTFQLAPELATNLATDSATNLATDLVSIVPSLVVALSGGSDSTALLIAMSSIVRKYSWKLAAAHINHGTRGQDSDTDEAFCRKLCDRLNIEFVCTRLVLPEKARLGEEKVRFSEDQLRRARYTELEQIARQLDANYLLLGHTLDDQTETMLFNLFRGTGLTGLKGMPPRRGISANGAASIALLRPLLNMRHIDCHRFLQELGQTWVEDSTNAEDAYTRNYIRHHVMPSIEQRFPKFQDSLANLRQIVAEAKDYLEAAAAKAQGEIQIDLKEQEQMRLSIDKTCIYEIWSATRFNSQSPALRKQLIAAALKKQNVVANTKRIQNLFQIFLNYSSTTYSTISLGTRLQVRLHPDYIIWEHSESSPAPAAGISTVVLPGLTPHPAFNKTLRIETHQQDCSMQRPKSGQFPTAGGNEALADFSDVAFPLVLRSRQAGDVIQPLGMKEKVRLKKFIHTRKLKLSASQRANLAVLADQDEVLWVPGCGISEKIRVKNGSSIYRLYWSDIVPRSTLNTVQDTSSNTARIPQLGNKF